MKPVVLKRIFALALLTFTAHVLGPTQMARAQGGEGKPASSSRGLRVSRAQPAKEDARAVALVEEGRGYTYAGKWEDALRSYRQALAVSPRYADAYIGIGDAQMGEGKYREAFDAYRQAIAVAPWYAEAHYSLGAAYNDMAQYGDAFKPF